MEELLAETAEHKLAAGTCASLAAPRSISLHELPTARGRALDENAPEQVWATADVREVAHFARE